MIKKLAIASIILLSLSSHAQKKIEEQNVFEKLENEKKQKEINTNKISLNTEIRNQLNYFLSQGSYQDFFAFVTKNKIKDEEYISYLQEKKLEGHIPLYWLMANYYAQKEMYFETHFWLYTAMIMTQQDSYLCNDHTARNAPRILLRAFPKTIEITTRSQQYIGQSMSEVIFFIYNLKNRINPKWVCSYGQNQTIDENKILINEENWDRKRQEVLDKFSSKYMK